MSAVWRGDALVLASTSATRRALLDAAGLPVEARAPGVDERAVEAAAAGLSPEGLAGRLAEAKALAVSRTAPGRIVLGADQVLDLDGRVFHKPADREGARAHLAALAGRTHALRSAAVLARDGAVVATLCETARLAMRPLPPDAIARYVEAAGDRVLSSVGAYQLEGLGVHLFERIEGDHSTILGLPLLPLLAHLRALGLLAF
jgi:septum formation protein